MTRLSRDQNGVCYCTEGVIGKYWPNAKSGNSKSIVAQRVGKFVEILISLLPVVLSSAQLYGSYVFLSFSRRVV